jgi:hypothetical protein
VKEVTIKIKKRYLPNYGRYSDRLAWGLPGSGKPLAPDSVLKRSSEFTRKKIDGSLWYLPGHKTSSAPSNGWKLMSNVLTNVLSFCHKTGNNRKPQP